MMAFGLPAFLFIVCMILGGAGIVLLSLVCAWQFRKIAAEKGHPERKRFWFCFLLGLPGWLMVLALPDAKLRQLLSQNRH